MPRPLQNNPKLNKEPNPSTEKPLTNSSSDSTVNLRTSVKLGVNPFDLASIPPFILGNVLRDAEKNEWRIRQDKPIIVDKDRPDEQCVEFVCGLLTAAMCIDMLRNEGRHHGNNEILRAYIKRGNGKWTRIPYAAVLTLVVRGVIVLNEKLFPIEEEPEPLAPPKSTFIFKGRKG